MFIVGFIGLMILAQSPPTFPDYLHPRNKPYLVGDKYCGVYVVWHTLRYYGRPKTMAVLAEEMQIQRKRDSSIHDVVLTLKANGISARAVKLNIDHVTSIDRPFIPFLKGGKLGHCVLCIPTGTGQIVTLDGTHEPIAYESALIEKDDEQGWDGSAVLIDGIDGIGQAFLRSGLSSAPTMVIMAVLLALVSILSVSYIRKRKTIRSLI